MERSPSPFRLFQGKRAASPGRGTALPAPPPPATPAVPATTVPTGDAASRQRPPAPMAFRRMINANIGVDGAGQAGQPSLGAPPTSTPSQDRRPPGGSDPQAPLFVKRESARPSTPTARQQAAAVLALSPAVMPTAAAEASGGGGEDGAIADVLQDRRNASRDAAAQKHQARLRAVRTSSRGKWGFSV